MKRCLLLVPAIFLLGCHRPQVEEYTLPDQVVDFNVLYKNNCEGCHGPNGRSGAARPLNSPVFLAVIGKPQLREVIANGVPQTAMSGFSKKSGGGLTEQQVNILVDGIEGHWSRPDDFINIDLPPYRAQPGDPQSGEAVFHTNCAICHGQDGSGSRIAPSIIDPSFLALASDQSLRTTVIAGRDGMPNWRSHSPGHAMTPGEISDVVAWVASHRTPQMILTERGTEP